MPLPTFNPPVAPSPGSGFKPQVNLLKAEFGDGYSQPTPKGINHIKQNVTLKWNALLLEQANEIEEFFERMGGNNPFYYRVYGSRAPMKWTSEEYEKSQGDDGVWTFSATLIQNFTNAV